jgi:hypothetical protein
MRAIILDSSSLITINMIGMAYVLEKLKRLFDAKFLITREVYEEVVDVPLEIKKYAIRALLIKKLIEQGIIEVVDVEGEKVRKVLEKANSMLEVNNEKIRVIHKGEASCIVLYENLQTDKKVLCIDERTTRMLLESPENLRKLIENKIHRKVKIKEEIAKEFLMKKIKIIRSSELLYFAFNRNLIDLKDGKKVLEAILYATKNYGCSIAEKEIEEIKNLKIKYEKE